MSQKVSLAVCSVVNGGVLLYFFWSCYNVLANHAPQSSWSWQPFIFLPLFIHGWFTSWAALQAFILTTDSGHVKGTLWLSARTANWLFLGGGAFLASCGLAASIVGTLMGNRLWGKYETVRNGLETLEASWTGTTDISGLLALVPAFTDLQNDGKLMSRVGTAECAVYAVLCSAIILVLIGGVGMAAVLQKNINYHTGGMSKTYEQTTAQQGVTSIGNFGRNKHTITRSDIRHMAQADDGPGRDRARLVLSLSKARADLVSISAVLALAASLALALLIFVCWKTATMQTGTWWMYEIGLLGIGWIYPPLMFATLLSLFWNVWSTSTRQAAQPTLESTMTGLSTHGHALPPATEKPSTRPDSRADSDCKDAPEFQPTSAAPFSSKPAVRKPIQIGGGGRSSPAPFPSGGKSAAPRGPSPLPGASSVGMDTFIQMSDKAESEEDPEVALLAKHQRV